MSTLTGAGCETSNARAAIKPARENFAHVCLWCGRRHCKSARCIALHARSRWMICDACAGLDVERCGCTHGVVEASSERQRPCESPERLLPADPDDPPYLTRVIRRVRVA